FPWLVLVPRVAGARELLDLSAADRARLTEEIVLAESALSQLFAPDKLNVGAIGNIVPQLHVHDVARRRDDAAWPGAVWGHGTPQPYAASPAETMRASLRDALTADAAKQTAAADSLRQS